MIHPPDQPASLGADLRALRKARGVTLAELAADLNRSVGWLSQVERDLSPRWRGVSVAHRLLSAWTPVWLAAGLTLLGVCAAFAGFSFALNGATEALRGQIAALDVAGPVTLDRPAPPRGGGRGGLSSENAAAMRTQLFLFMRALEPSKLRSQL